MRLLLLILFLIFYSASAFSAMPPKPGLYDLKTGLSITTGDPLPEFPRYFGTAIGGAKSTADVIGVGMMAVVLVDFPDRRADIIGHPPSEYYSMIFSTETYPTGSLNDFFMGNSYELFSVDGGVSGWHTTSNQYSYFDDGNYGLYYGGSLVAETAAGLSDPWVDFSLYDSDGPDGVPNSGDDDGYVDAFTVIHAGLGAEETGSVHDIWSHAGWCDYTTADPRAGGGYIRIDRYTIQPEERLNADGDTLITGISVLCHEYGHILGLPDFYDPSRNTWGIGYWGLMGYGAWGAGGNTPESPGHLCAWSKIELGWIDPIVIEENILSLEIAPVETNPIAYKIWRNGNPGIEYFLLENRQQIGFDSPAPGHGLLIWHYDGALSPPYNALELEQADGLDELNQGDGQRPDPHYYHHLLGDDGDPYPGSTDNTRFGPETNPSSDADNGTPTDVIVAGIREFDAIIMSDFVIDPAMYFPAPSDLKIEYACDAVVLRWCSAGDEYTVPDGYNVYRRVGNGGEWEMLNSEPVTDTVYTDREIILGETLTYGVTAIYDGNESSMHVGQPIYLPDPAFVDYLIVGDSSTTDLNLWYKSLLDSLGLQGEIVGDLLPYCGDLLSNLPVLWIVSFPGPEYQPIGGTDRETAITDYLDRGGRIFIDDGWIVWTETISMDYLQYDYTTCIADPFTYVFGSVGTFAEGLSMEFPEPVSPSYMVPGPESDPDEVKIALDDGLWCSSVDVVVDRLGFKAVVNSQPLHELEDGPNGTRLEFFNRMLGFFDIQTDIPGNDIPAQPSDHMILSAYPNPFNSSVRLHISSPVTLDGLTVEIFDITGRLVRKLPVTGPDIIWHATADDDAVVSSGIYFARVTASRKSTYVKLLYLE